eukprot:4393168-Pyramimonas_sp.AAC.1
MSAALAIKAGTCEVREDTDLFPHLPVSVTMMQSEQVMWVRAPVQPLAVDPMPHPGCSRFPPLREWQVAQDLIDDAQNPQQLAAAWDAVIVRLEGEVLDRSDIIDSRRRC